jgi:hypothetical protein
MFGGAQQQQMTILEGDYFRAGTAPDCDLLFDEASNPEISKYHCEIQLEGKDFWVVPKEGCRIWHNFEEITSKAIVQNGDMLFFGKPLGAGVRLMVNIEERKAKGLKTMVFEGVQRGQQALVKGVQLALGMKGQEEELDKHTVRLHRALERARKKQRQKLKQVITLFSVAVAAVGAFAFYQTNKLGAVRGAAEKVFYQMKDYELRINRLEDEMISQADSSQMLIVDLRSQRKKLEKDYEEFIKQLGVIEQNPEDQNYLIWRMAHAFGECELTMPKDFAEEVKKYIAKWKTTPRYRNAIQLAMEKGYVKTVAEAMLENDLPPQFLYLSLQESDFDSTRCGPNTRFGIAKGAWQFIPSTATQYGLSVGPLRNMRKTDPLDERHHFSKATQAAAKYIRRIYNTEAQASGLLVMASYNWGENRVRSYIRKMPENPRERNFWKLLESKEVPKETYDYVFYIFSAAVIGENPQLFGFQFDDPLKTYKN